MQKDIIKIISIVLITVILAATVLSGCGGKQQSQPTPSQSSQNATDNKEPIKIGHLCALTGDFSMWGQTANNALLMEIEKINAAGGINGKPLQLVYYDERGNQIEAVNVANKMIDQDKVVAILGPNESGIAIAATPAVKRANIPLIAIAATNPKVTQPQDNTVEKNVFRVCFIDPFQGKVAAQFAYNKLNVRKAAILYDVGSDYSAWLTKYFEDAFKEMCGEVVAKEAFRSGELDYRAMLGKIKQQNPELLFIPASQKEAALAAKQARDLGMKCTFMGGDSWASPDLITLGGSAIEGAYCINMASIEDPEIQGFVKEYRDKYNTDPIMPTSVLAIDALKVLIDAIKRAGTTDGPALIDALEKTKDLEVLTTKHFTMDPATHNPLNRPAIIQQVKDGKFVYVEKYEAK
ncbi:MAG TPA: ABC transporter substrate-binding protein [Thermoanaerobacterales bacterium]|nr:ABC transporter substrate-binding protein [Thermoanaerobacterales bacterium]